MLNTTLVLTAGNELQAEQFRRQLEKREKLQLLHGVDEWRVIPDPPGKRIGSGGSTVHVLRDICQGESPAGVLKRRRLLIIHAGGESRRMPAYSVCGKVFCPVPGQPRSALPLTLFDMQLKTYLNLPHHTTGYVTIFAGDVLLRFDPRQIDMSRPGLTGVAAWESPHEAAGHGVFADVAADGTVRKFVQKASVTAMENMGALDDRGRAAIDLGIMSFTPPFAERLLEVAAVLDNEDGAPAFDFYTEIACCLPAGATFDAYEEVVGAHGASDGGRPALRRVWDLLHDAPFYCSVLDRCDFLHFGATRDFLDSAQLLSYENRTRATEKHRKAVVMLSETDSGGVAGSDALVEGTIVRGVLELRGENFVSGALVDTDTVLDEGVCLDVLPGTDENGAAGFFHRLYGIDDTFKGLWKEGECRFLNRSIDKWRLRHGLYLEELWPDLPPEERSLWNAKLFPFSENRGDIRLVLWMQEPKPAAKPLKDKWLGRRRYSMQEMAAMADGRRFWRLREVARGVAFWQDFPDSLDDPYPLSADDLAYLIELSGQAVDIPKRIAQVRGSVDNLFLKARFVHTVASACEKAGWSDEEISSAVCGTGAGNSTAADIKESAFAIVRDGLLTASEERRERPKRALMDDQIVWARCPARLDLAGGWTDTPPYTLENGGAVVNAAVDLNGQPPVQVFGRVCSEPVITLHSIDLGLTERVVDMGTLLDYGSPSGRFSIAKAALALCGFSPERRAWPDGVALRDVLEGFGGGIELTTLCAVPKGSGLGTSSILGAAVLSTIHRITGMESTRRELFHQVLVLEQMLTTGGGWQDQIGGVLGGVKMITTRPGPSPDPLTRWLPRECLCPHQNGGCTMLYYTGITRLAKNILHNVVGRYLDRERPAVAVLERIGGEARAMRDVLERRDSVGFGETLSRVWELNKALDPRSSNERIEKLLGRVRPYTSGAKLLGAGGGGFLLIYCPDPEAARRCRSELINNPENDLGRFFDFRVNDKGLEVSVS